MNRRPNIVYAIWKNGWRVEDKYVKEHKDLPIGLILKSIPVSGPDDIIKYRDCHELIDRSQLLEDLQKHFEHYKTNIKINICL